MTAALPSAGLRVWLAPIVAKAAPLPERIEGRYFESIPDADPSVVEGRLDEWIASIADGDRDQFGRLLSLWGVSWDQLRTGLADVRVRDQERLPRWGEALVELLDPDLAEPTRPLPNDLYAPFAAVGERRLLAIVDALGLDVTDAAVDQCLDLLRRRLYPATVAVLGREVEAMSMLGRYGGAGAAEASWSALGGGTEEWRQRFELYPVLGYLVATVYLNWIDQHAELFERLARDADLLARELFDGKPLGQVAGLRGDLGDPHGGGRSVAVIELAGDRRVVYKPKDLRVARVWMDLVRSLSQSSDGPVLDPSLHVRKILPRGSYTWEEYVERGGCQDERDVERFYVRMGSTIRLLQLLEARDFWLDNLIAHGDHPVFVDLEMLLQPRRPLPADLAPAERCVSDLIAESAIPTGAITLHVPIGAGVAAEDLGALSRPRAFRTPFTTPAGAGTGAGDRLTWTHAEHAPTLDGEPADPACYLEQIVAGYAQAHQTLLAHADRLLAPDSPLAEVGDLPVRCIYRDTWSCYRVTQMSVHPSLLRDGVRRDRFLARLFRQAFDTAESDEQASVLVQVAAAEIEAFRVLDVPLFLSRPGSSSIYTSSRHEIPDAFDGTALDRLYARLCGLGTLLLDDQTALLRSSFSTGHAPPPGSPSDVAGAVDVGGADVGAADVGAMNCVPTSTRPVGAQFIAPTGSERSSWLAEAVALADQILASAVRGSDDDLAWAGLVYQPWTNASQVDLLGPDILSGTAGLAILFADLYAATGEPRFAEAARAALAPSLRASSRSPLANLNGLVPPSCGAYIGSGSWLYALRRVAVALDDATLDAAADALLAALPLDVLVAQAPADVVSGTVGLLLAMLTPGRAEISSLAAERGADLARRILAARRPDGSLPPAPYPPDATYLADLLSPAEGLALGLERLANARAPAHDAVGSKEPDADSLLARRRATGRWFPDSFADDRHNLSIYRGTAAIAHALLRQYDPAAAPSIRRFAQHERVPRARLPR